MDEKESQIVTFKILTPETKTRINELILNEKYCKELNRENKNVRKKSIFKKKKNILENGEDFCQNKGNIQLEAGKTLPKKYRKHFTPDLIGIPLEEIDDHYKKDHVNN